MNALDPATLAASAGVDPWALKAQLDAGDPDQIDQLAAVFYRASGHVEAASAAHATAMLYLRDGYHVADSAPVDASAQLRQARAMLADATDKLPKIAHLLVTVGDSLADAGKTVDGIVADLDGELATLDAQLTGFDQGVGSHLAPDDAAAVRQGLLDQAVQLVQYYGNAAWTTVTGYEHTLAAATASMAALGYVPSGLLEAGEQRTNPVPVGTDPAKVAAWWRGLTPAEQEYLLDHDYATLGQLRGLPAPILDTANRHRVADDEQTLRTEMAQLRADPDADPDGSRMKALQIAYAQDTGIDQALGQPAPGTPPVPIYLLAFDPQGSDGQKGAEMSFGDPDTARNVAVFVPGTGNDVSTLASVSRNALNLYNSMGTSSQAVVTWLDGPEPPTLVDAASDHWADTSSPSLALDIAGLRAAHDSTGPDALHLTAIGHSYGSYIVGKALTQGAQVDDAIFVGSPGVGSNSSSGLHLSGAHVWDGQSTDDPILTVARRFTPDPGTGHNPDESAFDDEHFSVSGSHGHSQYFTANSESVKNMARIALGDYGDVDTVAPPDPRGLRELASDVPAAVLDPVYSDAHVIGDLATGHPLTALSDGYHGTVSTLDDDLHVGEDVVHAGWTGITKLWSGL